MHGEAPQGSLGHPNPKVPLACSVQRAKVGGEQRDGRIKDRGSVKGESKARGRASPRVPRGRGSSSRKASLGTQDDETSEFKHVNFFNPSISSEQEKTNTKTK